jgi:hypothetical protein
MQLCTEQQRRQLHALVWVQRRCRRAAARDYFCVRLAASAMAALLYNMASEAARWLRPVAEEREAAADKLAHFE